MSPEPPASALPRRGLLLLTALALGLRIAAIPRLPTTYDEVDFVEALTRYDLSEHSPHFPGYPLYILAARLAALALPPMIALATPALISHLALLLALARRLERQAGLAAAWCGCALIALAPLAITLSGRPMSDALAADLSLLALLGLTSPCPRRRLLGALALGLVPGVKLDHALLLSALVLAPKPERLKLGALAALGLILWTLPFIGLVGAGDLLIEGQAFIGGHFSTWGGAVTASGPPAWLRPHRVLESIARGFGGPAWLAWPLLIALALAGPRPDGKKLALWSLAVGPFILWKTFGQNLAHPRHLLPLVLALAWCAALRVRGRGRWALAALAVLAASSLGRRPPRAPTRPDIAALAERIAEPETRDLLETGAARLYGGESVRVLRHLMPRIDARRARDLSGVERDLLADPAPPRRVFLSSELADVPAAKGGGIALQERRGEPPPPALPLPEPDGR